MTRAPLPTATMVALVREVAAAENVPPALLLSIARAESAFFPDAVRGEAHLSDASHGLMQILLSTARGAGYGGSVGSWNPVTRTGTGLYDPTINLRFGARHLRGLLNATGGDIPRAISAYNAGLGNAKLATTSYRFCLAWKPTAPATGRILDRDCANVRTVQPGEYPNQPYVTRVLGFVREYQPLFSTVPDAGSGGVTRPAAGQPAGGAPSPSSGREFIVRTVPAVLLAALAAIWLIIKGGK